jgi:hypothetical protein
MQYQYILKSDVRMAFYEKASKLGDLDCFLLVGSTNQQQKSEYMYAVRNSVDNSALEQKNKFGLQMFYTSEMKNIYYNMRLDCYAVMEEKKGTLYLQSVICTKKIRLEQVLTHIRGEYVSVILGFAPCKEDVDMFEAQPYDGKDDYRLFYLGDELKHIETEKLYFPQYSHA